MTSHSDGVATDTTDAVAGTVATVGGGVGNRAVATGDADLRPLRQSNAIATVSDDGTVA